MKKIRSFKDFYPIYLEQHNSSSNKLFHFIGTSISIIFLFKLFVSLNLIYLLFALIAGYGFAWVGHFFIEKNKPATFSYPLYSLIADYKMFFEIVIGKHKIL
tara:strand:+ start:1614 stop:1919 length:306 start_codon:yes stop_codon:yes gene_type:complete